MNSRISRKIHCKMNMFITLITSIRTRPGDLVVPRGAENGKMGKKIYWTNCLPLDSLGLGNTQNLSYCPIVGQLFMQMVGQCCVQLSNGRTVLCPTVQRLVSAVSNCPMIGLCCVQLSNGRTVLCQTVQ